jgi:hypothetical protein
MSWKIPEQFRFIEREFGLPGDPYGAFKCASPSRRGYELAIIASPGGDIGGGRIVTWEHVSVHVSANHTGAWVAYCPTWAEMDYVKGLFWDDTDVVMQLHVNDDKKVDIHKHTLHLWRPTDREIPLPDKDLV